MFLALLAIVGQLVLASAVPAAAISLADVMAICQHDDTSAAPGPAPYHSPAHHAPDCSLCFFCHGTAGVAGILATAPTPPAPVLISVARAVVLPPATAPPLRLVSAACPRGPPIPV